MRPIDTSGQGGGQADERGFLYVATGTEVQILDKTRNVVGRVAMNPPAQDVAPSPDGSHFFAVQSIGGKLQPQKYVRQADGSYQVDRAFKLEPFEFGGKMREAEGLRIATDGFGNLFVADGTWTSNSLQTVIKFSPEGKYLTRFGTFVDGNPGDDSSWEQGRFYWALGGIAVSRDGRSVYTTEIGNNRVQRWDVGEDGHYTATKMWGATKETDPNRQGSSADGQFAAPYDIGVDAYGTVYVMNTTVNQIQAFDRDGNHIYSKFVGRDANNPTAGRSHGLAVTWDGDAISVESGRVVDRSGPDRGPLPSIVPPPIPQAPDVTAPTIGSVAIPTTTTTREVDVRVEASDDRKVHEVRLANEDGSWGPWVAYQPVIRHMLLDGIGTHGIFIQVRDLAGNESAAVYRTLDLVVP